MTLTPGRPRGPLRQKLVTAIEQQPGTAREIAGRTQLAYQTTAWMLKNMVEAGEAVRSSTVRVDGVLRPVPVYAAATHASSISATAQHERDITARNLQRVWSTWWPNPQQLHATDEGDDGAH